MLMNLQWMKIRDDSERWAAACADDLDSFQAWKSSRDEELRLRIERLDRIPVKIETTHDARAKRENYSKKRRIK